MHLDEGQIQRLVHADPDPSEDALLREHADRCAFCDARIVEAHRENERIGLLLRDVDHPVPPTAVAAVIRDAEAKRPTPLRRAAAIILFLGVAGAASAAPGSPVRRWIENHAPLLRPAGSGRIDGPQVSRAGGGGIALMPGVRLVIDFASTSDDAIAVVSLDDGPEVVVQATDGEPRFISAPDGGLRVVGGTARRFRVSIPRAAARVEIVVSGRLVLLAEHGNVSGAVPAADGNWIVHIAPG